MWLISFSIPDKSQITSQFSVIKKDPFYSSDDVKIHEIVQKFSIYISLFMAALG